MDKLHQSDNEFPSGFDSLHSYIASIAERVERVVQKLSPKTSLPIGTSDSCKFIPPSHTKSLQTYSLPPVTDQTPVMASSVSTEKSTASLDIMSGAPVLADASHSGSISSTQADQVSSSETFHAACSRISAILEEMIQEEEAQTQSELSSQSHSSDDKFTYENVVDKKGLRDDRIVHNGLNYHSSSIADLIALDPNGEMYHSLGDIHHLVSQTPIFYPFMKEWVVIDEHVFVPSDRTGFREVEPHQFIMVFHITEVHELSLSISKLDGNRLTLVFDPGGWIFSTERGVLKQKIVCL